VTLPRVDDVTEAAEAVLVVDLPPPSPEEPDAAAPAERLWTVAIGVAAFVTATIARASQRAIDDVAGTSGRLPPIPRAAMGAVMAASRATASLGTRVVAAMDPDGERRASAEEAAVALIDDAVPRIVAGVVERVDLTRLILDHIDLDEILRSIDLEAFAEGFPVEDLAKRVDVRELAGRVDLEDLLRHVDLAGITLRVIDEIDLPAIIRGSTEDLSGEAIDALRFRTMHADQLLSRWRDRLAPGRGNGSSRPGTGS
jgi:hypothetical protein